MEIIFPGHLLIVHADRWRGWEDGWSTGAQFVKQQVIRKSSGSGRGLVDMDLCFCLYVEVPGILKIHTISKPPFNEDNSEGPEKQDFFPLPPHSPPPCPQSSCGRTEGFHYQNKARKRRIESQSERKLRKSVMFSNWLCDVSVKTLTQLKFQRAAFNGLSCSFILGKVCYQLPRSAKSAQNRD